MIIFKQFLILSLVWVVKARIKINLDAKWKETSIASEISEFIAKKNPEVFWDFVENVQTFGNDEADYESAIAETSKLMDSTNLSLLKLSMSIRQYSPKVQLHSTFGKPNKCSLYYKYGQQIECDFEKIIIKHENKEELFDFDHLYSSNITNVIIVYGTLGSDELKDSIKLLKTYIATGKLTSFVLRHHNENRSNDSVSLSGYGVELVMKNTEYKVIDGTKQNDSNDLHGFNILKLKLIHSNLGKQLNNFRSYLQKTDDFSKPLNNWDVRSLSIQAIKRVKESNNPLEILKEITQNFPLHLRNLSHINVDGWRFETVDELEKGANELRINGRLIDNDVNVFDLIDILEEEKTLVDRMVEIGIKNTFHKLTSVNAELMIPNPIFDYRKGNPIYLNDVEKEYGYPSIQTILHATHNQILPIAKNIFTLIFVLDPKNEDQEYLFDFAKKFTEKTRFIRVGIISENSNIFLQEIGLFKTPRVMLNGELIENLEDLEQEIMQKIIQQTKTLQFLVYNGMVSANKKIENQWLDKLTKPLSRLHYRILETMQSRKVLEISRNQRVMQNGKYSFADNSPIVVWIVGDFKNARLQQFSKKVLKWIGQKYKVALISNTECYEAEELDVNCGNELNELIDVEPGNMAIIVNSLIFGPLNSEELFRKEDFDMIFKILLNNRFGTENVMELSSLFYKSGNEKRKLRQEDKDLVIKANFESLPKLSITWVINPTSREAQHLSSIVELIQKTVNSEIRLIFNPEPNLSTIPIDRFYRYVVSNEISFDEYGNRIRETAHFDDVPRKKLMTLGVLTHHSWMIELQTANHDLDNILIESNESHINAGFTLENLLIEGTCVNKYDHPASGTQIEVSDNSNTVKYDTIVMENLGYFQLKAYPGVWSLKLLNGEKISTIDGKAYSNQKVILDSLSGNFVKIKINEMSGTSGFENEPVSILDALKSYIPAFNSNGDSTSDEINVFSLASGHLYERFLKIMMLSVVKNTKSKKITFWLLKNYVSPEFKKSIPELADKYGFNVNFVEYRWPKWLNKQTEKQRIMWGYKILFLDVLFPLNVDKIIFVDADQVVRADLRELMSYDLEGAPYGYVPFCDSRKEMDGYRFWKSEYWKNVLGSRKYHISALYVVDLKKFREIAAGDKLRGQYHMLSRDPNSLSNLDQDLPNFMIRYIPIKSLPQEWLWCETWCDDKSKSAAKTIDLCNNPLTKEPKLDAAVRIIEEWKGLDQETRKLSQKPLKVDL